MAILNALLIRSGELGWAELASVVGVIDGVRVVAETGCAHQGVELAARVRPDVVLAAPRIGAVAVPAVLLGLQWGPCPAAKIILFSTTVEAGMIAATAGLRYDGWLLWPELSAEGLPHLLRAILFGEGRIGSPSFVAALLAAAGGSPAPRAELPFLRLSPREREVLALLGREGEAELTIGEIAVGLGIKASSVATYVDRLGVKLGVERGGRRAVVVAARRGGLVA